MSHYVLTCCDYDRDYQTSIVGALKYRGRVVPSINKYRQVISKHMRNNEYELQHSVMQNSFHVVRNGYNTIGDYTIVEVPGIDEDPHEEWSEE